MLPLSSCGALAWAMTYSFSSIAERYSISSVILLLTTLRYGVSRKPYLLVRANTASELIRPMFGPSGVSIVQPRTEESRLGKACVRTCIARWSSDYQYNNIAYDENLLLNLGFS